MFWGLILKANKKYSQELEKSFHLSHAALDTSVSDDQKVQVMYVQDGDAYLLCTLQKDKVEQFPLDLNFSEGSKVCFSIKGNGIVHLSGFLIPEEEDFDDFGEEEESENETAKIGEASEDDLRKLLQSKGKSEKKADKKPTQKPPVEDSDDEDSEPDMEDGDDSDDEELNGEADSDDEGDDSDESEEEEIEEPKPKQQKLDKKAKQNGVEKNGTEHKKPEQKQDGKPKQLQGGVTISDIVPGTGPEAKNGKKVKVLYVGRLQSNNSIFDSTKNAPFAFSLGRGEVIRGWDVGVVGMKVGGKRRITCPPAMAYGAKGAKPAIPPNATLVFEVELKHVK